jgi:hypothetical protein
MAQLHDVRKAMRTEQGGLTTKLSCGSDIAQLRNKQGTSRAYRNRLVPMADIDNCIDLVDEKDDREEVSATKRPPMGNNAGTDMCERVKKRCVETMRIATPTTKKTVREAFKRIVNNEPVAMETIRCCGDNVSSTERLDSVMDMITPPQEEDK